MDMYVSLGICYGTGFDSSAILILRGASRDIAAHLSYRPVDEIPRGGEQITEIV